jgi:hypothetical protein
MNQIRRTAVMKISAQRSGCDREEDLRGIRGKEGDDEREDAWWVAVIGTNMELA